MINKLKMHRTETKEPPKHRQLLGAWEEYGKVFLQFTFDGEEFHDLDDSRIVPPTFWCELPEIEEVGE